MLEFIQHTINGLILGGAYVLIGVGLTMVLGIMRVINFAHGELYMLGAYFVFTLITFLHLNFFVALIVSLLLTALVGACIERVVLKPLRGRELNTNMLAMIGVLIALQNIALLVWGPVPQTLLNPFPSEAFSILGVNITPFRMFVAGTAMVIVVSVHFFIQKTTLGKSMRAAFQDMEMASMLGVRIDRVFSFTFGLGSAMAAVSGVLLGVIFTLKPTMGEFAVTRAFAVVILGGMGSFPGAIVGGLILGVSENLAAAYISSGFKDAIAFMLIVLILIFKPAGLISVDVGKK
jgi:branched-chain amino acid transport system permease protein